MLNYTIRPASPEAHLFEVELEIADQLHQEQALTMPAWIPGSYMIRNFARNVVSMAVFSDGSAVPVTKLDKQTWLCADLGAGNLLVRYQVYAWELTVRSAHLDTTHAYYNGAAVFLRPEGRALETCQVNISPPQGDQYVDWQVATSLRPTAIQANGFGRYQADNYHDLIDHPVEIGHFQKLQFEVGNVPHYMVLSGKQQADGERLTADLESICQVHADLFGALPIDRYFFLTQVVGSGYGGLEHSFSTSLLCSRDNLPRRGEKDVSEEYRQFLGLCSHEYFHLWNVKRIQPGVFQDNPLVRETYTQLLWVFEGITSYYDELALIRAGCISTKSYLDLLARNYTRLLRGSGRLKQTLVESSFDAWTKFYMQDENAPNAIVSYYTKGAVVALSLDLTIRLETDGRKSLDDVMRALWERHGVTGIGVPEQGVEALVTEVTGIDLSDYFQRVLRTTEDPSLGDLLSDFGIGSRIRRAKSSKDQGGALDVPPRDDDVDNRRILGATTTNLEGSLRITQVFDDGAAQKAGLAAGDVLVAINGIRITPENLDDLVDRLPDCFVRAHVFRRDELMALDFKPLLAPENICELWLQQDASPQVARRRDAWLGTKTS